METRYLYESYRYRSEWRVRRTPCKTETLPDGRKVTKPTGPSEIVETGLHRVWAISLVARLYNEQNDRLGKG